MDLQGNAKLNQTLGRNLDISRIVPVRRHDVVLSVSSKVRYGSEVQEHPASMPQWQQVLRGVYAGDDNRTSLAIHNLTQYIVNNQRR